MDAETIKEIVNTIRVQPPVLTKIDDETAYAVLPEHYRIIDASNMLPPPNRPKQRVTLLSIESFSDYVRRFKAEHTAIFANEAQVSYEAVLDYHAPNCRGTCDHVATFKCQHSPQWLAWINQNGKLVKQGEFARHIENNLLDIVEPSSADMMQVALSLDVKKNVKFQSDIRLSNGQHQFRYEEEIRGTVRALDIEVPETFSLVIPVFDDEKMFQIAARLRYRLHEGDLQMGYELVRHSEVLRDATKEITQKIRGSLYGIDMYTGARGS